MTSIKLVMEKVIIFFSQWITTMMYHTHNSARFHPSCSWSDNITNIMFCTSKDYDNNTVCWTVGLQQDLRGGQKCVKTVDKIFKSWFSWSQAAGVEEPEHFVCLSNRWRVFVVSWGESAALCWLAAQKYTALSLNETLDIVRFECLRPSPSKLIFPFTSSSGFWKFRFRYPRNFRDLDLSCLYQRMLS